MTGGIGRGFEKKILGKNGSKLVIRNKRNITFTDAIRNALSGWDGDLYPDTDEASALYYRVNRYLRGMGVKVHFLVLLPTVQSAADILYQTDAVFYLVTESGGEYLVTIDLLFTQNPAITELFTDSNRTYQDIQSEIYRLKRLLVVRKLKKADKLRGTKKVKCRWPKHRPDNHFILTQFDVLRPRGLKTLSREIAHSLFRQVRKKEGQDIGKEPKKPDL